MMKKSDMMLEKDIQKGVVDWLESMRRYKKIMGFSVPNEGKRHPAAGKKLKAMGLTSGVTDLVLMLEGAQICFIELKAMRTNNGLSENQKSFFKQAAELGHKCFCVTATDVTDAINQISDILLENYGWS